MARILSDFQKKEIFKALPSKFTIGTVDFNASKKYANQLTLDEQSIFPIISLNYPLMGGNTILSAIAGNTRYYSTTLTIHILAKSVSGLNGAMIAEGIADNIIETINGWELTPLTGGVMILSRMNDIKPLGNLGILQEYSGVFDYILTVELCHI